MSLAGLVSRTSLQELYVASSAARWDVTFATFAAAVVASVDHRFRAEAPTAETVDTFIRALHLEDLGLACGCRAGHEQAWEHFIREVRPRLYAAAGAGREMSRELVDSLFAELFGMTEVDGERRSLLTYYHGRARLVTWLRTVLAQRHVDSIRASARTVPLDDEHANARTASSAAVTPDPHQAEYVDLAQRALDAAVERLDAGDRLRLRLYYGEEMTLAQIGRLLREHEATVSRKLERARRQLRAQVEQTLRGEHGLTPAAIAACLREAAESPALDMSKVLAKGEG